MEAEDIGKAKPDALKNCLGHSPNQRHSTKGGLKQTCPVSYVIKQRNRSTTSLSHAHIQPYHLVSLSMAYP